MPTYDYRCETCENTFEVFQSFSEDPLTSCPSEQCQGSVKKIFSAPGIAFKGSGFYKNDSRSKSSSSGSGKKAESAESSPAKDSSPTKDSSPEKPKKAETSSSSTASSND
ncbi:MAG: FmdB family transcriptional regulator [Acidimicrobiaceae bacterium]|nr:FmdB family transcriptional regulator [Acidimicrobiaceae bacterium]